MQVYKAPLNDMKFLFQQFLRDGEFDVIFENTEFELSDLDLILDQAAQFCEEELLPINQTGDSEGCKIENGKVITPNGFKEAYKEFVANGWQSATLSLSLIHI